MWKFASGLVVGLLVAEYYNRARIDQIPREQLADLRIQVQHRPREVYHAAPRRANRDLITPEQFDEMQRTGRTAGKRISDAG